MTSVNGRNEVDQESFTTMKNILSELSENNSLQKTMSELKKSEEHFNSQLNKFSESVEQIKDRIDKKAYHGTSDCCPIKRSIYSAWQLCRNTMEQAQFSSYPLHELRGIHPCYLGIDACREYSIKMGPQLFLSTI